MGIQERKEREREQRRNHILDSARTVFLRLGIEQSSMDKIATEAELSKGTLYLYFRNRDELLGAMLVNDLMTLVDMLRTVQQRNIPVQQKVLESVMSFHRFSRSNEFFYKVVSQMNIKALFNDLEESKIAREIAESNTEMIKILTSIFQEGIDNGEFILHFPVEYTVRMLMYALKGTMVLYENGMMPPTTLQESPEQLLQDLTTLFISGLKTPSNKLH